MKKRILFSLILSIVILINFIKVAGAETLTVTTYYPSPYGIYQQLRLMPTDSIDPLAACSDKGEMYYDDSDNQMYVCNGTSWQSSQSYWTRNLNDIYPNDINSNAGIGTNNPSEKLHVVGNVQSSGEFAVMGTISGVTLDCITVQSSYSSDSPGILWSVQCPVGYIRTGGGGDCDCIAGIDYSLISKSYPDGLNNGWIAGCYIEPASACITHRVTTYARCCRLQ